MVVPIVLVFDNIAWNGKDVGDNSCFWKPAVIVEKRLDKENREVVDVIFLDNLRVSRGHFVEGLRPISPKYKYVRNFPYAKGKEAYMKSLSTIIALKRQKVLERLAKED